MDESVAVKVAGALKGVVRIRSFEATVSELRAEVARLMGKKVTACYDSTAAV